MDADLSQEIQRFEEKFAENPDSLVFARLADLYRKAGDPERALGVLDEGLDRHPDYLSAHIVRARALRDLGRAPEAERVFERVLRMDSHNLVALRSLGELALARGDEEEARRRFEALLELDPRNQEIRERLEEMAGVGSAPAAAEAPPGPGGEEEERPAGRPPGEDLESPGGDLEGSVEEPASPAAGSGADTGAAGGAWWRRGGGGEESSTGGEADDAAGPPAPGKAADGVERAVFDFDDPDRGAAGETSPGGEDDAPPAGEDVPPGTAREPPAAGEETAAAEEKAPAAEEDEAGAGEPGGRGPEGEPIPRAGAGSEDVATSREEAEFLGLDGPGGDTGSEGGSEPATEGGLPAEEGLRERIEELSVEEGGAGAAAGEGDEEDLLTETLASLYETQGFYEEAVEMYEELLRQRPGDESLRKRLEDARTALEDAGPAAGSAPSPGEPTAAAGEDEAPQEPVDEPAGEPAAAPGEEAPPVPPAERDGGEGAGASVREHLRALLRGEAGTDAGRRPPGSGA